MSSDELVTAQCEVAIFKAANEPLELRNIPTPQPGPEEVLIRVDACTVCGSDLHTILGNRKEKTPTILGHEIVGTVAESGCGELFDAAGQPLLPGDRVTWSVCLSCGSCDRCRSGLPQKCYTLRKVGHEVFDNKQGLVGGFSGYILLPSQAPIFKLSEGMKDEVICPANCATATVMAAFQAIPKLESKRILILGAGLLGITACAIARTWQAKQIVVLDPDDSRKNKAAEFGADQTFSASTQIPSADRFDVALDFSGSDQAIEQAMQCLDIGGHMVLVGSVSPSPGFKCQPEFLVRNLIKVVGVHNYAPRDLQMAVQFLESYGTEFPFSSLVERTFSLAEINEAVSFAVEHKPIRIMVRP